MTPLDVVLLWAEEKGVNIYDSKGELRVGVSWRVRTISQNIKPEQLESYALMVMRHPEFLYVGKGELPSLALMEKVLKPDADALKAEAEKQFSLLIKAAGSFGRYEHFQTMNPRLVAGMTAIVGVGGWTDICNLNTEDLHYRRKNFVEAYCRGVSDPLPEPVVYRGLSTNIEKEPKSIDSPDILKIGNVPVNPVQSLISNTVAGMMMQ